MKAQRNQYATNFSPQRNFRNVSKLKIKAQRNFQNCGGFALPTSGNWVITISWIKQTQFSRLLKLFISQVPTVWKPVYHTRWKFHTVPFNVKRQAGKLRMSVFNSCLFDPTQDSNPSLTSQKQNHYTTDGQNEVFQD